MKNFMLILFGLFFLSACQEKKKDDSIIKQAISNLRNDVEEISSVIEREFNKGMRRPLDKLVYLDSQKYKGWREKYYKNKGKANLLAYSDSIAYPFYVWYVKENKWDVDAVNDKFMFLKQMKEKKQLVLNSADPFVQQELLFWALETEKYLQSNLAAKLGGDCKFGPPYDLYLSGEKFKLGDTVYAIFKISPKVLKGLRYKADSLFVTNLETKEHIAKTILQIGPYFTIRIIPKQKGIYMITGKLRFYTKLFKWEKVYLSFDKKPFQVN